MRLALLLLSACGRIGFDVGGDGGGGGGDGGSDDAGTIDGRVSTGCLAATPATTFPGGPACDDWAGNLMEANATVEEIAGTLIITPQPATATASGSCQKTGVLLTLTGVFAEVSEVLGGTFATTRLEIARSGVTYYIGADNGIMRAGTSEGVSFSGGSVARWWRIRPLDGEVFFETSPDGTSWISFASVGAGGTLSGSLRVIATTPVAEGDVGSARFESVNVCPQ